MNTEYLEECESLKEVRALKNPLQVYWEAKREMESIQKQEY